jgi:hypothetical protein
MVILEVDSEKAVVAAEVSASKAITGVLAAAAVAIQKPRIKLSSLQKGLLGWMKQSRILFASRKSLRIALMVVTQKMPRPRRSSLI